MAARQMFCADGVDDAPEGNHSHVAVLTDSDRLDVQALPLTTVGSLLHLIDQILRGTMQRFANALGGGVTLLGRLSQIVDGLLRRTERLENVVETEQFIHVVNFP